jgi:nitroreductase
MELIEAIHGRRSIRKYRPDPVPLDLVKKVLEAGTWAPSAKNGQQWRFTVLTGESKRKFNDMFDEELRKFILKFGKKEAGSAPWTLEIQRQAPVLIIVWNAGKYGWITEEHSVAAAIQNILLYAYDLGLSSLWIGDVFYGEEAIVNYFNKSWKLSGAIALGYSDDKGKMPSKKSIEEMSEFLE